MKNIFIALLLMVSVSFAQFQTYDTKEVTAKILVDADYIKLVDNFQLGNSSTAAMLATGIDQGTIQIFFDQLKQIEVFAQRKMNKIADSELEVVPTIDTQAKLITLIAKKFNLSDALASYVVGKMVVVATKDKSFSAYKSAVIQPMVK